MVANEQALARLLSDDDPSTVLLVKQQLAAMAEDNPRLVEDLANGECPALQRHAKEILRKLQARDASDDFLLLCHLGGDLFDIEKAAWLLSRALLPEVPTLPYEELVNECGIEFLSRIHGAETNEDRVRLLGELLCGELHFSGNADCYYCEENSLLPRLISTRRGIPISLSLLYMMIGARAGMKIEGINLPGHFIARHGDLFFDPFHGGRILSGEDLQSILSRQGMEMRESHLQPASPRQFLMRTLANLLYVYDLDADTERHGMVKSWMDALACGFVVK
jgi:hypothetical protein